MVLNQGLIPESSVDVAINESVYELHFKVELERNNSRPISMDMADAQTNNGAANGYEKDDERRRVRLVLVAGGTDRCSIGINWLAVGIACSY
jgi:hypothetical protein